jgi:hypothetical protein
MSCRIWSRGEDCPLPVRDRPCRATQTDCVLAPLEALYKLFGGKDGYVTGDDYRDYRVTVPITGRRFDEFRKALVGNGRAWVDALVGKTGLPRMGKEITDLQTLRVGDMVQLEGHRAFVAGRIIDHRGVLNSVVLFDANRGAAAHKSTGSTTAPSIPND